VPKVYKLWALQMDDLIYPKNTHNFGWYGWIDGVPGYSTVQPCGWMIMCPKDTHNFWAVQMDDDVPKNIHNFGQ